MSDYSVFELANIAIAGFAAVSAVLLLLAYAVLIDVPGKSIYSMGSCVALVAALTAIQIGHLVYFTGGAEPLEQFYYQLGLFVAPPAFYSFGRWALLPTETFRPFQLLHFLPVRNRRQAGPACAGCGHPPPRGAAIAAVSCDRPASYRPRNEALLLQTVLE